MHIQTAIILEMVKDDKYYSRHKKGNDVRAIDLCKISFDLGQF